MISDGRSIIIVLVCEFNPTDAGWKVETATTGSLKSRQLNWCPALPAALQPRAGD
jgi:hypothetical protein